MGVELATGAVIGGLRIEALIGRGAMGEVYRAHDGEQVVALKLLDEELSEDERFRQRFLRESQIAERLDHANIVPTIASGEDGGRLYLAMELIDGSDLRRVLRTKGRLDPQHAVALIGQIADALDSAHRSGLVHRDVKPGNILLSGDRAYICDFGLARHVSSVSSLTGDRGFVGTIDYVPPEQIEGGTIDARADVYSLGCVLYECLTGLRPFERDSELSVVFAHLNEPPPRATDVDSGLPAAFDDVFATALAKSPAERYSSCPELASAARAALHGRVLTRRRPRRRLALAAGVAVLVAAASTAVLLTVGHGNARLPATITPTGIGAARLGQSNIALERLWGGGVKLSAQFPPDYSLLQQSSVDAYFAGTVDKAVELITWSANDRTAAGVGPCSSFTQLQRAYGKRLVRATGYHGLGWRVGKHLFFALTKPAAGRVGSVAVYSDTMSAAGYNALNEGPCTNAA
jgi:tRNA A-37 threonylcarbamoyl transferase component Bud32